MDPLDDDVACDFVLASEKLRQRFPRSDKRARARYVMEQIRKLKQGKLRFSEYVSKGRELENQVLPGQFVCFSLRWVMGLTHPVTQRNVYPKVVRWEEKKTLTFARVVEASSRLGPSSSSER
jgi:hypothetical protein